MSMSYDTSCLIRLSSHTQIHLIDLHFTLNEIILTVTLTYQEPLIYL